MSYGLIKTEINCTTQLVTVKKYLSNKNWHIVYIVYHNLSSIFDLYGVL